MRRILSLGRITEVVRVSSSWVGYIVHLILLLHGAVGIWDEVLCLVVPATALMGVALAVAEAAA